MRPTRFQVVAARPAASLLPLFFLFLLLSCLPLGAGCSKRSKPAPAPPAAAAQGTTAAGGPLVVFAAASLREAFTAVAAALAKADPGAQVTFNFAGSQELRAQIEHGAPADVFASADTRHMEELQREGHVESAAIFAHNEPVIVVATEKAAAVHSLGDLAQVGRLVIGAPDVPIGRYTLQIFAKATGALGADWRARLESRVVSRELNVRQVLAKVSLGEADAAIVYRTDAVAAAGRVTVVAIPPALNVVAAYPIAVVTGAPHPAAARAFVALVLSAAGQEILKRSGFLAAAAAGAGGGSGP